MHNIAGNFKRTNSQFTERWSLIHFCRVTNSKLIHPVLDKEASRKHLASGQSSLWWRSWRRSEMSWTRSSRQSRRTGPTRRSASPYRGLSTVAYRCDPFPYIRPRNPPAVHIALDWPLVGLALVSSSSFLVVTTCALVTLDVVIQSGSKAYCHKCCTFPASAAQLP